MKKDKVQDTHDNNRNIGQYSTIEHQIMADPMKNHSNLMGKQMIPNQTNLVGKYREDSLTCFGVLYRTEKQTPKYNLFTSERQATEKESQSRE